MLNQALLNQRSFPNDPEKSFRSCRGVLEPCIVRLDSIISEETLERVLFDAIPSFTRVRLDVIDVLHPILQLCIEHVVIGFGLPKPLFFKTEEGVVWHHIRLYTYEEVPMSAEKIKVACQDMLGYNDMRKAAE